MSEPARLSWLLRRGMKELDVIVTRYHQHRYASASAAERTAFFKLLTEAEDPDIWSWVMGHSPVPVEYSALIDELRQHH